MYLDGIETVHNRRERNEDSGECSKGLTVFTQTARPTGCRRIDGELSDELCDIAHWQSKFSTFVIPNWVDIGKLCNASNLGECLMYQRDDVEAEVIPIDETMAEHEGNNEDEEHDIPDVDMDVDMDYDM
uniref:Uncharacterized protein n=1 Tax=Fagus sylvatica TaxID=28930 RepID=A0A2N9I1Y7_FAGSY